MCHDFPYLSNLGILRQNSYNFTSSGKAFLNSPGRIKWSISCIPIAHLLHTSLVTFSTLLSLFMWLFFSSRNEGKAGTALLISVSLAFCTMPAIILNKPLFLNVTHLLRLVREHEYLGQIEAARDWPNGKEQHHQLELLQDHKAETLSTGIQYAKRTEHVIY